MKIFLRITIVLILSVLLIPALAYSDEKEKIKRHNSVFGYWYMGTMAGEDWKLYINRQGLLSLKTGGCFATDPEIKSDIRLEQDKIFLLDTKLQEKLGNYLKIVNFKGHLLLLPENRINRIKQLGLKHTLCFWPNLLKDKGLQLPVEAYEYDQLKYID